MSTFTDINYPYFKKGQVLTNTDLNNMVEFLDEQNRLSRVLAVGSGIFSGLDVNIVSGPNPDDSVNIDITKGFGISSDGYILELPVLTRYQYFRELEVSKDSFRCKPAVEENSEPEIWNVLELLQIEPEDASPDSVFPLLDIKDRVDFTTDEDENDNITNYCLVLWLSQEEKDRPYCIDVCDDKGADLDFSIKTLLIKYADLLSLKEDEQNASVAPETSPVINIPPFGFKKLDESEQVPGGTGQVATHTIDLSLIGSFEAFRENYTEIIKAAYEEPTIIYQAYEWAYNRMVSLGLASEEDNPFASLNQHLENLLTLYLNYELVPGSEPKNIDIQYLYLYLQDLKRAYEEFLNAICKLKNSVLPDMCAHARYIALSGIEINKITYPYIKEVAGCRTHFQLSLFNGVSNSVISEVEQLFKRMKKLTNPTELLELPIQFSQFPYIKATPGRDRRTPLSRQSIPYYYKEQEDTSFWTAGQNTNCFDSRIKGYRYQSDEPNMPVLYQDDEYEFYRIEGHVGKNTKDVYDTLKFWVEQNNMPINVKYVFFDLVEPSNLSYASLEMTIIEEKYKELREAFVDNNEALMSLVPENIEDNFNCTAIRDYFNPNSDNLTNEVECYINALQVLHINYSIEKEAFTDLYSFKKFAKAHPGMQHLGGVPKGGTFIVVSTMPLDTNAANALKTRKELRNDPNFRDIIMFDDAKLSQLVSANSEQVVVGDFALPYACCDASVVEPMIIIVPDKFCGDDENKYEIFVYPRGGKLGGSISTPGDGISDLPAYIIRDDTMQKYYFLPNQVLQEGETEAELVLTYSTGGLSAKSKVIVYKQTEEPGIIIHPQYAPVYDENLILRGVELTLSAEVEDETATFDWQIDGRSVIQLNNDNPLILVYTFNFIKSIYNVEFIIKRGACTQKSEIIIDLCDIIGRIDIEYDPDNNEQFSENPEADEKKTINATPLGGVFKLINEAGIQFEPNIIPQYEEGNGNNFTRYSLINMMNNPLPEGEYKLSYYLPDCNKTEDYLFFDVIGDEKGSIILKRYAFCFNDKQRYPIYIHPEDAELSSDIGGLIKDGNKYFFEPSAIVFESGVNAIDVTVTLTDSSIDTVTKILTIYRLPEEIIDTEEIGLQNNEKENCQLQYLVDFFISDYPFFENQVNQEFVWAVNGETKAVYNNNSTFRYAFPVSQSPYHVSLKARIAILPDNPNVISKQPLVCEKEFMYEIDNLCEKVNSDNFTVNNIEEVEDGWIFTVNTGGGRLSLLSSDGNLIIDNIPTYQKEGSPEKICNQFKLLYGDLKPANNETTRYQWRYLFDACNIENMGFAFDYPKSGNGGGDDVIRANRSLDTDVSPGDNSVAVTGLLSGALSESGEIARVLNNRKNERQEAILKLEQDNSLVQTKTFGLAKMFTLFVGSLDEVHERYQQASDLLFSSIKRAKESRKLQFLKLLEIITHAYLDKIVIENKDGVSSGTREHLHTLSEKLKEEGIDTGQILISWGADDLGNVISPEVIKQVENTIK